MDLVSLCGQREELEQMGEQKKRGEESDCGALIQKFRLQPPPFSSSSEPLSLPLQGLAFAVKDIFDISGYVTGFGSPDWARTHAAATATAPVVSALLNAGATCVGKAIMDELAFSVNGENKHYGTPVNPCAPDRAPGGSSSGSAVAVAAKLVDFSLGTDTGGSVRVPAAYCGILGFRPSHGIISTSGVIPFAQSFDTVGWFARDPSILTKVGRVLLQSPFDVTTEPTHIIVPEDCFQHLGHPNGGVSDILINSVQKIFGSIFINQENFGDYLSHRIPSLNSFMSEVSDNDTNIIPALSALSSANTMLQRFEFKFNHDEWLNKVEADFGPGVIARLSLISKETFESIDIYQTLRAELQTAMDALLEDFGVLAIPTVTGPPPELQMKTQTLGDFRAHALRLVCIAGLSGICQVTIPLGMHDNLPVSISLLASKGNDPFLLKLAETLYATLREEAAIAWELDIEARK